MNICSQCGKTEREQQHELCYRIDCWRQFRFTIERVNDAHYGEMSADNRDAKNILERLGRILPNHNTNPKQQ